MLLSNPQCCLRRLPPPTTPVDELQRDAAARKELWLRPDGHRHSAAPADRHLLAEPARVDPVRAGRLLFLAGRCAAVRYARSGRVCVHHPADGDVHGDRGGRQKGESPAGQGTAQSAPFDHDQRGAIGDRAAGSQSWRRDSCVLGCEFGGRFVVRIDTYVRCCWVRSKRWAPDAIRPMCRPSPRTFARFATRAARPEIRRAWC